MLAFVGVGNICCWFRSQTVQVGNSLSNNQSGFVLVRVEAGIEISLGWGLAGFESVFVLVCLIWDLCRLGSVWVGDGVTLDWSGLWTFWVRVGLGSR